MATDFQSKVMADIVATVIKSIEAGVAPWQRPWDTRGCELEPTNLATGHKYAGLNRLYLWLRGDVEGCSHWIGYQQAKKLGGRPKKGCKVWILAPMTRTVTDKESGEKRTFVSGFKAVGVFNARTGVDGLEHLIPTPDTDTEPRKLDASRLNAFAIGTGADIRVGGDRAFYNPSADHVQMPKKDAFRSEAGYYGTLIHELTHWTGHRSRLDRFGDNYNRRGYAFEELIAELGAYFTANRLECPNEAENHASYLKNWLEALGSDPKYLWLAASRAERASDFLVNAVKQHAAAA